VNNFLFALQKLCYLYAKILPTQQGEGRKIQIIILHPNFSGGKCADEN
jgi:hypothetical protein